MDEKISSPESPGSQHVVIPGHPSTYIKPQGRKPHDPDVKFEEYYYYAQRTREEEKAVEAPKTDWREIVLRKKKSEVGSPDEHPAQSFDGKDFANSSNRLEISDEEWTNASRAFRTASWGACE
jgi:hypothetical protein